MQHPNASSGSGSHVRRTVEDTWRGVPIRERTDEQIRDALAQIGGDETDVEAFIRLRDHARDNKLGLGSLCDQCGIPQGTLSPSFNGTYQGDVHNVTSRIIEFFTRLDIKREFAGLHEFVETRLYRLIASTLDQARAARYIKVIQSDEQLGKTTAALEYQNRHNHGRTQYVSLPGGATSGVTSFLWNLGQRFDIPRTVKNHERRARIQDALATCDLLIIDEVHLVESWPLKQQRDFWDYLRTDLHANGARGVVLIATNQDVLRSIGHFARAARYNAGQLIGRMDPAPFVIDAEEILTEADIRALVERYYQPTDAIVTELLAVARRPQCGHLGLVCRVMVGAWKAAMAERKRAGGSPTKAPITDKHVRRSLADNLTALSNLA